MMLVAAYCAGLRIGEIVRLNVEDFDANDRSIEIRGTKFFKSRRLPLSDSVVAAFQSYLGARQQAGAATKPDVLLIWHQRPAGRYSHLKGRDLLVRILRRTELKPANGAQGTPHSRYEARLRHEPYARVVLRRRRYPIVPPMGHSPA